MTKTLDVAQRSVLSLVFTSAGVLKAVAYLWLGRWDLIAAPLRSPAAIAVVVGLDLAIAGALWTRFRSAALWGAMTVAVCGNFVFWWASTRGSQGCGCFGSVVVRGWEHVLVSTMVFFVALRNQAGFEAMGALSVPKTCPSRDRRS